MSKFYIDSLIITGKDKKDSILEFSEGLNIVHGVSDTGKTCILKCIDFIFGGSDKTPIPEIHGYDTVKVNIKTETGLVSLTREIGKNKIYLTSTDTNIESGEYTLKDFGDVLLPLIGICGKPKIIKNSRYEKQRLTWRTFMHSFVINEEEVVQEMPILVSKESTAKTASLSGLLYLLTAIDFDTINPQEDRKIKEARKRAVEKYITNEISNLSQKKEKLNRLLETLDINQLDSIIQKLSGELSIIEKNISNELGKGKNMFAQIIEKQKMITECDMRLDKYREFKSQCQADIERLGFIVDVENKISKLPKPDKCPYCDNELSHEQEESYIETANFELKRILSLLDGIEKTSKEIENDKLVLERELSSLTDQKKNIDNYIQQALKPRQQSVQRMLENYKSIVQLQNELNVLDDIKQEKFEELARLSQQDDVEIAQYKPKEHFPINFENDFTNMLKEVLQKCKYERLMSVLFLLDNVDATINAKPKSNYGKGFRAFINMSIALTMRKYLIEKGRYAPRLLIVDSALLNLEQGVDEFNPESMKAALMKYLMETQSEGQTIIIENKIPNLNYDEYEVNLIEFTKGKKKGRYGLLMDCDII